MGTPTCYAAALTTNLLVAASEQEAVKQLEAEPDTIDALVVFHSEDLLSYSIRMNHTDVPDTQYLQDVFDVSPGLMPTPGNMLWCVSCCVRVVRCSMIRGPDRVRISRAMY